jgi:uncharacterized protein YndB with AHSA1/START domain
MASWRQEALIEAPVEEVWDLLIDPARSPEWSKEVLAVTGAPVHIEKGSTFDVTSRGPLGIKGTTTFRVEELRDMHEVKMQCQLTGFYSHWILTEAQGGTFTQVELGIEQLDAKRPVPGRVIAALHTKPFLRRTVEKMLDDLRGAMWRYRQGTGQT